MFIDFPTLMLCPNQSWMCRATLGTVPENLAHKPNSSTTPTNLSLDIIDYREIFSSRWYIQTVNIGQSM